MTPRCPFQRQEWSIEPYAPLKEQRDVFDNPVFEYAYLGSTQSYRIEHTVVGQLQAKNPFDFVLPIEISTLPIDQSTTPSPFLCAYLDTSHFESFPDRREIDSWLPKTKKTLPYLTELNSTIHANLTYISRDAPGVQSPATTLSKKSGTCRDYAALLLYLLRSNHIPARFVSGYLLTDPHSDGQQTQGADAMHAWVEVYLPGAGWRGLDPTNGVLADGYYLPCAVSLTPEGATPIEGKYYSDIPTQSHMKSQLEVTW